MTTDGVGLENTLVFDLKAGGGSCPSTTIFLFNSVGGSAMKLGNLPSSLFFLPGPLGLKAISWIAGRDLEFFNLAALAGISTWPNTSLGLLNVPNLSPLAFCENGLSCNLEL